KGKINQAMAHGVPVVATTIAVEGMHLQPETDVLVADQAQAFADAVLRLHTDETRWNMLSMHGLENVQQHFSRDAARDVVRNVLLQGR
ncbi:MAG: glycosyltransferase, partial [Pseudoxanthomonas sp.]